MKLRMLLLIIICATCFSASYRPTQAATTLSDPHPASTQAEKYPVIYKIAFVPQDFSLKVQANPYPDPQSIDTLDNGETVQLTGTDKTPYVYVMYHDGKIGWINSAYIVGDIDPAQFCSDPRPKTLIKTLMKAVKDHDGKALSELVMPQGLTMSLDRAMPVVHLDKADIVNFFSDQTLRNWGPDYGGPPDRMESLAGKITTLLETDLLPANTTMACNDNQDRLSEITKLSEISVPGYTVINFYSVLRPGASGDDLNWGAWGLGIGYWQDAPRLVALTHYVWTP